MKESTKQMLWMYEKEGRSLQEIATQFNISRQAVHGRLKTTGYTPRPDSRYRGNCNESVVYSWYSRTVFLLKAYLMDPDTSTK